MDLLTDKPVLFEWKFADCKPLKVIRLIPLDTKEVALQDVLSEDFVSVTISAGEHLRSLLPKESETV